MEFNDVIRKRTATRKFSNKKISQEDIIKILEAGNLAPTAKNFQPHYIYVVLLAYKNVRLGNIKITTKNILRDKIYYKVI